MTLEEWKDVARLMNSLYDDGKNPMFEKESKVIAWYSCLSDMPYEGVSRAIKNLAMRNKFRPSIAEIRAEVIGMITEPDMSEGEAWAMVRDGIRNGTYGATEEFNKFPPVVQRAVGNPMSLSEWAMMSSDDIETIVHSQFLRSYRAVKDEEKDERVLGQIGTRKGEMKAIADSVLKRLEVDNADSD